jgi:hypothetical protein
MAEEFRGQSIHADPIEVGDDDNTSEEYYEQRQDEDPDEDSSDDDESESGYESSEHNSLQYGPPHHVDPRPFICIAFRCHSSSYATGYQQNLCQVASLTTPLRMVEGTATRAKEPILCPMMR